MTVNPSSPLHLRPLSSSADLWLWPLGTPSAPLVQEKELTARAGLTPAETLFLEQLKPGTRRLEWLAVRVIASEKLQAKIVYTPEGKPRLLSFTGEASPLRISVSHTQGYAALMACRQPCGTDIEPLARCASYVAGRIASPYELKLAESIFPLNPELLLWCAKETAYKATDSRGADLRQDMILSQGNTAGIRIETPCGPVRAEFSVHEDLLIVCGQLDR